MRRELHERQTAAMTVIAGIVLFLSAVLGRRRYAPGTKLPKKGGFIVALNHLSVADPPLASGFIYDHGWYPRFMAKAELFKKWPLGAALRSVGQIPVERGSRNAAKSLQSAAESLALGRCVIIFPEGTTNKTEDLWPMEMKSGAVRLALTTGAPIIPAAMWGSAHAFPPKLLRRPKVTFITGEPLDLSAFAGRQTEASALRDATALLRQAITDLLGELRGEQPPAPTAAEVES